MPTTCSFTFSRPVPIYYGGEQISGRVLVRTTKRLTLTAIKLKLLGTVHVEWREKNKMPAHPIDHNDCTGAESYVVAYQGLQPDYLKLCLDLAEGRTLEAGATFAEDFTFSLPEGCEASNKLECGEVCYKLQLVLKREATFNKIFQQRVVVRRQLDLNVLPLHLSEACSIEGETGLLFGVPCRGFVPGQLLPFQLRFLPGRAATLPRKVTVKLYQHAAYRALEPNHRLRELSHVLSVQKIKNWFAPTFNGTLRIPLKTAVSTMDAECLLRISYFLSIVITGEGKRILEKLYMPITIGTVSLRGLQSSGQEAADAKGHFCFDNLGVENPDQHTAAPPRDGRAVGFHLPSTETLLSLESTSSAGTNLICDRITLIKRAFV